jgi:nickel/cobalt exporter
MVFMTFNLLLPIVMTGFAVAFFHALLPTHWLPFVLAAKGQGWSHRRALAVVALASLGHAVVTSLIGIVVVFVGFAAQQTLGHVFPLLAGSMLVLLGLYYLYRQKRGLQGHHHWGHGHLHSCCSDHVPQDVAHILQPEPDPHHHSQPTITARSDKAVILGLFALLTFSPCEGFLPVYLSGVQYGWVGFALLSLVLAVATMLGMVFFTAIALTGLQHVHLRFFSKYEAAILGVLLCALGAFVLLGGEEKLHPLVDQLMPIEHVEHGRASSGQPDDAHHDHE